jgi:molybdenum cofactor guanylyltransferase
LLTTLERSAIILCGNSSDKFGKDKALLELNNKPLLNHVIDAVKNLVEEVIVVTTDKEQKELYAKMVSSKVRFAVNEIEAKGHLAQALSGFEIAQGHYSLLLPLDSPFILKEIIVLLFDLCIGKSATIPRWTNNRIEPLHAVYHTPTALKATKDAVTENKSDMETMVNKLRGVRYISTMVIEQLDPELHSFFKIKTPSDLKKANAVSQNRLLKQDGNT